MLNIADATTDRTTRYRTITVDGLRIFYREAGRPGAPAILLLHGLPSSSRTYEMLLSRLGSRFRLIAPDYPGYGHSNAPPASSFSYTFDHLAEVMNHFTEGLGPERYVLFTRNAYRADRARMKKVHGQACFHWKRPGSDTPA